MTKSKHTVRALTVSVLSMILCVAMLIGSTFAWFTDSVTSGQNKIVAGNLDVELYHSNGAATDEKVGADTNLFVNNDGSAVQWEPGVMVYENFTVRNVGSLALKYRLTMNVGDFNTVDGGKSLKDVLKVAILDGAFSGDRTDAEALTFNSTVADFVRSGNLTATGDTSSDTYAVVIYWEPTADDNAYNLSNGKTSSDGSPLFIDLGIDLSATQDTVESDSFDNQYDKYATYPDAKTVSDVTEFTNVIQNAKDGDVIALADDMILTAPMTINKGITIVGNGNTISGQPITTHADVTFKNVKLSKPESTKKNASLVYAYNGCEELVFDGCTFSDPQWEAMQITSNDLKSVTITNCTFTAANVDGAVNSGYGSEADQAIRFIHIQPSNFPVVNIKIANNKFLNCDKIADGVVGIYYVSKESTITVGGNTFEGLEIENGNSGQLSVGWPEVEALKTVSYWTGEEQTFVIDSAASNPLN